jgi:hypothetical protein
MRIEIMPKAKYPLFAAVFLALVVAAAGTFAAENSTDSEDSLLPEQPTTLRRDSILSRWLKWPEKAKPAGGDADSDEAEEPKDEPLESDRPDFTEATTTVGLGRLQIEGGYKFTHGIGGVPSHDAHDLPEMLLRYGVAERLELRAAWDEGVVFDRRLDRNSGRVVTETGFTDVELGVKYAISKQDKWRPQTAMIVALTAPVGSSSQTSGQVDVRVNYLYSWEFNKKTSLNCSTGNLWTGESGDHFSELFQAVSLEYEWTEKLHVFGEWYALVPRDGRDNRTQHYFDSGLTYLLTPNVQLDWSAGLGLSDASDRFFTGCGVTIRR